MTTPDRTPLDTAATYLDRVIAGAERVQRTLCAYGGSIPCDCKYGGPSSRSGSEQTGCPELREAVGALRNLARVLSGEPVLTLTQWREYQEAMDRA